MTCPLCEAIIEPKTVERYREYTICRCPACDVIFADPMRNPGAEWYEKSELYALGKVLDSGVGWQHRQFLKDPRSYGKTLLDVGCGPGAFLNEARKKGYHVWGIDFDRENIKIAKKRFAIKKIYPGSVAGLSRDFSGIKFDVVTFFEVLEHLDEPLKFIKELKAVLKPGGHIALSMPNRDRVLDPLGEGDYPPNHLSRWNRNCLTGFLERNGFEVIRCDARRFDSEEMAAFLKSRVRFGIAKRMAKTGIASKDQATVDRAARLMGAKDVAFKCFSTVFAPLLDLMPLQGSGLFALARLRN